MTTARCPTCHRPIRRSNASNACYWALVHEIAEQIRPAGNAYGADSWHCYLKTRFLGADDMKLPNGKVIVVPKSSSSLDTEEFADYLAKCEAWASEKGIYLEQRD